MQNKINRNSFSKGKQNNEKTTRNLNKGRACFDIALYVVKLNWGV